MSNNKDDIISDQPKPNEQGSGQALQKPNQRAGVAKPTESNLPLVIMKSLLKPEAVKTDGGFKGFFRNRPLGRLHIFNWVAIAAIFFLVIWAAFSEIEQITRATGQVIASSRTQIIQAPEGGVLEELLVRQGDQVEAGQILAKLEKTKFESAYLETRAKAAGLRATVARLTAEVMGGEPKFSADLANYPEFRVNQMTLFRKRRSAIDEDIASLQLMLSLAQRELEMNEPLLKRGDVSGAEVLRLQRQVADLRGQIANKRNKYLQDAQAELSKTQEDLAGVEQLLSQRKEVLSYTMMHAPVRGIVKNVRVTTRGGVLRPGDELMQIVPIEGDLVVEAKVKPQDVAFLKPGLSASVKIDAYDYTIFGTLHGKLTYISPDTLEEGLKQGEQPYFRIQVTTEGRRFSGRPNSDLDIQPGMTATVELRTGSNTVLRYLAKPVVKTMQESMGER